MDAGPEENLYRAKLAHFLGGSEPLARLFHNSIVVQRVAHLFASGLYATREEALVEVIAILNNQYDAAMRALVERSASTFRLE